MINVPKINKFYRNSCKGKNALMYLDTATSNKIFNKHAFTHFVIYSHFKYLKHFLNFDNVYIFGNNIGEDEELKENLNGTPFEELKDSFIVNIARKNVLIDKKIDIIFIDFISNNFFGGIINSYKISFLARALELYFHNNKSLETFIIQDDPQNILTDLAFQPIKRLFIAHSLKPQYFNEPERDKLIDDDLKFLGENIEDAFNLFNVVYSAFTGIDYEIFFNNFKEIDRPKNIGGWDNLDTYIWASVNDHLEYKFADGDFNDKKYDCSYVGFSKNLSRTINTERFFKRLKNKFLHVYTRNKPFFRTLNKDEHYDGYKDIYAPQIYTFINANAKSTFVSHNIENIGNQLSPRFLMQ